MKNVIRIWVGIAFHLCNNLGRMWNQPKRPMTDEWMMEVWYVYAKEYYEGKNNDKIFNLDGIVGYPVLSQNKENSSDDFSGRIT